VPPTDAKARLAELQQWAATQGRPGLPIAYGDDSEQLAELRLPAGDGPHPVAVLLHGGFWRAAFTRSVMDGLAVDLTGRGWATWNVEYRRVGCGGGVPETLEDVRTAISALAAVDIPPIRPTELLVIGHSAGGQLALCAAALPAVTAVVSLAGVCDLRTAARDAIGDGAAVAFCGGTPLQRPDAYALADPLTQLPSAARVLLVHGDADDRVPIEQSRAYRRAAGPECELLELPGVDHFDLIDPRSDAWARITERIDALDVS
jgi:acetyl esterase/lipase